MVAYAVGDGALEGARVGLRRQAGGLADRLPQVEYLSGAALECGGVPVGRRCLCRRRLDAWGGKPRHDFIYLSAD
jgi:hypothetical protein